MLCLNADALHHEFRLHSGGSLRRTPSVSKSSELLAEPRVLGVRVAEVAACGRQSVLRLLGRSALCKAGCLRGARLRPKLVSNLGGDHDCGAPVSEITIRLAAFSGV